MLRALLVGGLASIQPAGHSFVIPARAGERDKSHRRYRFPFTVTNGVGAAASMFPSQLEHSVAALLR
jgi:hypothetical protein